MNELSVVLPAHDEEASIGTVVDACLRAVDPTPEVIVVDDGSTDRTAEIARNSGARVLSMQHNGGKGAALRRGISAARHDVVVALDADGQDDARDIPRMVAALESADLVIGSRFLGTFETGSVAWVDDFGNRLLTATLNRLFSQCLTDTQAGFRAARRETWLGALAGARGYEVETIVLTNVLRSGGRVVEVPVRRLPRAGGQRDFQRVRDGLRILGAMLVARLR